MYKMACHEIYKKKKKKREKRKKRCFHKTTQFDPMVTTETVSPSLEENQP